MLEICRLGDHKQGGFFICNHSCIPNRAPNYPCDAKRHPGLDLEGWVATEWDDFQPFGERDVDKSGRIARVDECVTRLKLDLLHIPESQFGIDRSDFMP